MSQTRESIGKESHAHISDVRPCTLTGLNYGDKVKIDHAHTYKFGYWKDWASTDYWYRGIKNGAYYFVNCDYKHECFSMDVENEGSSILKGVYVV